MKYIKFVIVICCVVFMSSCATTLQPARISHHSQIEGYKYVYITPTSSLTSGTSDVYGGKYGIYGSSRSKSVNPSDIIAGYMMKKGFIQVPEVNPELAAQTLIVNYGETGRRYILGGLLGYTIEVTLQLLSAKTHELICVSTAEGLGPTEADDIRMAITRALEEIFSSKSDSVKYKYPIEAYLGM